MKNDFRNLINNSIRDLIFERGEILTKGAFGTGGRAKGFVANAKARAESDPKGLMKDLGITSPAAGSDLQKVQKILNAAIHGNSAMSQAYVGTKIANDKPKGLDDQKQVLVVSLGELDRKDGIRFLAHTLRAASNAGFLTLDKSIQFSSGATYPIVIYEVEQSK